MTKKPAPKRSRPAPLVDAAKVNLSIRFLSRGPVTRKYLSAFIRELLDEQITDDGVLEITSVTVRDVDAP